MDRATHHTKAAHPHPGAANNGAIQHWWMQPERRSLPAKSVSHQWRRAAR